MRKILLLLVLLSSSLSLMGSNTSKDSLWTAASAAYSEGMYDTAVMSYLQLENLGYGSPELYYNIGNSYFKQEGYNAKAILYYEKALKLNPNYKDAQNNLAIAHQLTLDKIDKLPEFVLVTWVKQVRDLLSSNVWAYCSLALIAMTALLMLLFRYGRSLAGRKVAFIFALITFLMALSCFGFALNLKNKISSEDNAIIMTPVSSVRSAPNASGKSVLILHEGTKVNILERLGEWSRIEISDGRQGWMLSKEMEII